MNTKNYIGLRNGGPRNLKRRITGIIIIAIIILASAFIIGKLTENSAEYQLRASLVEENRVLREQAEELASRIEELEQALEQRDEYIASIPTAEPSEEPTTTDTISTAAPITGIGGETPRTLHD